LTTAGTITYTVTPTNSGCTGAPVDFVISVNPAVTVAPVPNITGCPAEQSGLITFSGAVANTQFNWTNSNTSIGLAASGSGSINSFAFQNAGTAPITSTITVTPSLASGCSGSPTTFTIVVNPKPTINNLVGQ